jgi:hypothetical protein
MAHFQSTLDGEEERGETMCLTCKTKKPEVKFLCQQNKQLTEGCLILFSMYMFALTLWDIKTVLFKWVNIGEEKRRSMWGNWTGRDTGWTERRSFPGANK